MNNKLNANILWIDDEIELLKMQIMFLEKFGCKVKTSSNGIDAIDLLNNENFDIIFIDQNMPGLSGLQTVEKIRRNGNNTPLVMITKNEDLNFIQEALSFEMVDFLVKPVNPPQIIACIQKVLKGKELIWQKTKEDFNSKYGLLFNRINMLGNDFEEYKEIYKEICSYEILFEDMPDEKETFLDMLKQLKKDAQNSFCKYIKKNYTDIIKQNYGERPIMQIDIFKHKIMPLIDQGKKVFLIVIDNLRYDHYLIIEKHIQQFFKIEKDIMLSILPTSTQYARNSMFSGLMPWDIQKLYPNLWTFESEQTSKNIHEQELIEEYLKRNKRNINFNYFKSFYNQDSGKINQKINEIKNNPLNIAVYNFVDLISHKRSESDIIKEIAFTEEGFRDITHTWFKNSKLFELLKELSKLDYQVILTTDHGSVWVDNAIMVTGEKTISNNPRYKIGKELQFKEKEVANFKDTNTIKIPQPEINSKIIFATSNDFMAYPNNFNKFANEYKNTFQHGGISMEEMLIPLITLSKK